MKKLYKRFSKHKKPILTAKTRFSQNSFCLFLFHSNNESQKIALSKKEEMGEDSKKKLFDVIEHKDEEVVQEILQTQEIEFNCKDPVISFVNSFFTKRSRRGDCFDEFQI